MATGRTDFTLVSQRGVAASLRLTGTALLALLGLLLAGQPGHAESAKQKMEKNRQKRNEIFSDIRRLESQKDALRKQMGSIDEKISSKRVEIRKVKKELQAAEAMEKQLNASAEQMKEDLSGYKDALSGRVRAIYMQGDMTYLDLLFQASDFGDLIDRVFFVQTIGQRDSSLITDTQEQQQALANQLVLVGEKREEIKRINEQLQGDLTEMQTQRQQKANTFEEIRNSQILKEQAARDLEQENKRIAESLRRVQSGGGAGSYKGKPWSGSFKKPVSGPILSGFGYRNHPIFGKRKMHTGVDIAAPEGTTIHAAGDGKVVEAGWMGGYGNAVIIDHGKGRATLYGHCSELDCKVGDVVKEGDKIAEVGSTGYSTGPHCHFEVRIKGEPVDPLKEL